ncbi:substrate-binding periplasmic protein [Thalassotalea euphylliae]|uniref:Solute-binding protein family 3/N-terminal domain-containing protein n=1 Tax=Thalassotalea euphylliae TaxID=1655234 RepID=A0A3E0U2X0_9GAMM|nr:transporter substrate-binding domain-containing protein [Thalassotalea euphylliae]REL31331.1 hypothetical protein DXX94_11755 [Thalassotalea euphylliae]
MKKVCFALLLWLFVNPAVLSAQHVKIATYDTLPPFAFTNKDGELTGIYIEIVKAALARMPDYTASFNVLPWARAKQEAAAGATFAILPPYFHAHDWLTETEPKRPYIWPYSLPLFTQHDVVVCNENAAPPVDTNFPMDYQGLRFVMARGDGRAGEQFFQLAKEKKVELKLLDKAESIISFLLLARADCTIMPRSVFSWYVKQMKQSGEYQKYDRNGVNLVEATTIFRNDGYLGYSDINAEQNFPFKKDFAIKFDIEIYKMKKTGVIQQIVERFIAKDNPQ